MPKYFLDERKLRHPIVQIQGPSVTKEALERILSPAKGGVSICVAHDSFPKSCLGYVFNVQKKNDGYALHDIIGVDVLDAATLDDLCSMMNHVMGAVYSDRWQAVFQKRRNEIGLDPEPAAAAD